MMTLRPAPMSFSAGSNGSLSHKFERIDRLHVVMAVEKHMRRIRCRAVMMGDDHRVAGRVADAGVEADRLQIGDQPFGGAAAFGGVGRIGRDRLDAEQAEQALHALVEVLVETVKDGGERQHFRSLSNLRRTLVHQPKKWERFGNVMIELGFPS